MFYITIFFSALILSIIFTILTRKFAIKYDIVDRPVLERKIHKKDTPFLGGIAIFLAFFVVSYFVRDKLTSPNLEMHHWLGVFVGACFLMIGGFLDDKYNLKAKQQIIWPILAALSVIIGGVGIEKITNPLGGIIKFDLIFLPQFLTFFWLMVMMYTTKLLDGIDGLVTSIAATGSLIIFLFTMTTKYYQPDMGAAALIFFAACLGFLIFNWHPAKIFLGEGGSLFLGFILGVLAIISGGKIAIALLIMGIPILDTFWTILRRLAAGQNPFKHSDRLHLHFRILDLGIGQRKTVLIYSGLALIFGLSGLFLQSLGKIYALIVLFFVMLALVVGSNFLNKNTRNKC
ncbi:MAG: MraY family glycosyltransferase [Patescibacteria group bacterium]|nr:MraY family glycosyltransferase [Patescibacteria group bacterium]MDD4611315.1 MraY family glycosyltransferase [Patescibacteria group bacterium]